MNWLQVQLLVHTHSMSAVLYVNTQKHTVILLETMTAPPPEHRHELVWSFTEESEHAQLGVVFFFAFLILCLDLQLHFTKKS